MGLLQEKFKQYREPQKYMAADVYPYFREITGKQGTEVEMDGHKVLMFGSNAYTGLTGDPRVEAAAKAAIDKYGTTPFHRNSYLQKYFAKNEQLSLF